MAQKERELELLRANAETDSQEQHVSIHNAETGQLMTNKNVWSTSLMTLFKFHAAETEIYGSQGANRQTRKRSETSKGNAGKPLTADVLSKG